MLPSSYCEKTMVSAVTYIVLILISIQTMHAKRIRVGPEMPTLSFVPICALAPRPMQIVSSLTGTFSEPISPAYHHNNFPSTKDDMHVNNAPISYGGILNRHVNIDIDGYEGKHVMEKVAILFQNMFDVNKVIKSKSNIRRQRLRVTNDHGGSGLTVPSYYSYNGIGVHKFKFNVTLGINYWIYLTVDKSVDNSNKKMLDIHFIGLTKDFYRHFNVIQHTFYTIDDDDDYKIQDEEEEIVSVEVTPDATIKDSDEKNNAESSSSIAQASSRSIIPNVNDILNRIVKYNYNNNNNNDKTSGTKLKIMSFNVWNTNPPNWVYPNSHDERINRYDQRMELLANVIKKADPDIVGFQEVRYDSDTFTDGGAHGNSPSHFQLKHILNHLKDPDTGENIYQYYVWQPSMLYFNPQNLQERVEEGAAIISKYPIVSTDYLLLPRFLDDKDDRQHQRVCLHAKILIPKYGLLDIFTTHLSLSEQARTASVSAIWDFIQTNVTARRLENVNNKDEEQKLLKHSGAILLGDLNSEPQSYDMKYLIKRMDDFWLIDNEEPEPRSKDPTLRKHAFTFPSDDPKKRIDFIFGHKIDIENDYHTIKLYGQDPSEDTKSDPGHGMLDNDSPMWASDHRAIMLTLNMS